MNISIKLKHTQLVSLVATMETMIDLSVCENRHEAIIATLMVKFYKKLKEKTVLIEPRNYTFSIGPETAMAFIEFFKDAPFTTTSYEGNFTQNLIAQFDKETISFF